MKYSIDLLFATIAWSSTYVFAQTYEPPADKVIQEKLNLTMPEFIEQCQTHSGVVEELEENRALATKIANALSDELVEGAKKSPQIDERSWDQLIKDYCLEDVVIKILNESNVDHINKCFDEENELNGEKKADFTNAFLEAYCAEIKRLSKEKYAAAKN